MGFASAAIFDEHLAALDHLNVVILRQWLIRVKVEEGTDSAQDLLNVLRVCLELALTNAFINLLQLRHWVLGSSLAALLDELVES